MSGLRRAFWLSVQLLQGVSVLLWMCLRRQGAPLVFTHHHDRDVHGRDRQMGPLLEELRGRCVEVARVPLSAATLRRWRCACLPYAPLLAVARLLAPFTRDRERTLAARARVVGWLLRRLQPCGLFLIDESGSGQPFVRAARALGIRSVGIQHGDFTPGSAWYDRAHARGVVPADVLCVWSEWFRGRLLAISGIYHQDNTRVTGRLRYEDPVGERSADLRTLSSNRGAGVLRVAVIGEASAAFAAGIEPYLTALRGDPDIACQVQPHPAAATPSRPLADTLAWCDVALGMRSSALLEALWLRRPVVVVGAACDLPQGLVAAGLATRCDRPGEVAAACRAAAMARDATDRARAVVWGAPGVASVREVLAAGGVGEWLARP